MIPFLFLFVLVAYSELSKDRNTRKVTRYLIFGYTTSVIFPSYISSELGSILISYICFIIPLVYAFINHNKVGRVVTVSMIVMATTIYVNLYYNNYFEHFLLSWINNYGHIFLREGFLVIAYTLSEFDEELKYKDRWLRRICSSLFFAELFFI